jgi:preprotein translocase subunit SecA
MFVNFLPKIFGTRNQRLLRKMSVCVAKVNALEADLQALRDQDFPQQTEQLKQRLLSGETLDQLLPEAFALVREASRRVLGMRHFDVQLLGGMTLHAGKIAEMRTGEGKTLVATLAAYLNALTGRGVHVITVNDYLASRDAEWMGQVYRFLGLSVGINTSGMSTEDKQAAYAADITYGTNNEFGFDFLRDNMAFSEADKTQRALSYAIVDEVDSILIDEARTPLIISGAAEDSVDVYAKVDRLMAELVAPDVTEGDAEADFTVDEKTKQVHLTEQGQEKIESLLQQQGLLSGQEGLFDAGNISLMYHVNAALRAHFVFHRDVDYVVKNKQVMIVDEHTGRLMAGRRWSDGLHQAIEAKESVPINAENQTLASITFQNYFRQYDKLAGMTGTADTEAAEFRQIYGLEVVILPTNRICRRLDGIDKIYLTQEAKYQAIVVEIQSKQQAGQPVLVGTASIEASEHLSKMLQRAGVKHEVLNAKQHAREASIIAQAGVPGTVTIATNMAGRGTDIVLGGNVDSEIKQLIDPTEQEVAALKAAWEERHQAVIAAGGLHVLGTERHESRRIDNQLRGRSGRQGDPGSTQFYLSLQDNLMRIFASEKAAHLMKRFGMQEHEAIEHRMVGRLIENAQRRVEAYNFDVRKQLLQFDDVANEQRQEMYAYRNQYLSQDGIEEVVEVMFEDVAAGWVAEFIPEGSLTEAWNTAELQQALQQQLGVAIDLTQWVESDADITEHALQERVRGAVMAAWQTKRAQLDEHAESVEQSILLQCLDAHWKEHLTAMDHLRQGISLRGYAQKNPIQEYKREAFTLFMTMLTRIKREVVSVLLHIEITEESPEELEARRRAQANVAMDYQHSDVSLLPEGGTDSVLPTAEPAQPIQRDVPKVGRNDLCPCGSNKKYKHCCGRLA